MYCVGYIDRWDPYEPIWQESNILIMYKNKQTMRLYRPIFHLSHPHFILVVLSQGLLPESQLRDVLSERQIMKNHEKQLLARYQLPIAWSHLKLQ